MTTTGVVRGQTIVLDRPVPFDEGQQVNVDVKATEDGELPLGSPQRLLRTLRSMSPLSKEAADEFEQALSVCEAPANYSSVFDEEK